MAESNPIPDIAVVILNWNGQKFLEKFLPSVLAHSDDAEVIVADNASADHSVEWLAHNHPEVRIIRNGSNGGFAKGYNDALRQVEAKYYVLLNSDIEVPQGWLRPMKALMDASPQVAACQPRILHYDEPDRFEYAGAAGGFIDRYGYPFCRGRIFQDLEKDTGQYSDDTEVFWATGACLMVRAACYHAVGGLDDDFFAHMEEIDLCWRLKNAGHKIMACGKSHILHVGGGTLPKQSSKKTYLNFRNNFILLYKNLPARRLLPVFLLRILLDWVAALKFLSEGGTGDFRAVIRAHWHFMLSVRRHHRKRMAQPTHILTGIYNRSIVADYYLRKKKKFSDLPQENFSK
ncbi:MAG TPA: glycosyltransferase family 2 protein [Bacteroidales bacterium]|nr:glycosyltransferase family 2 protein [Bacteroidales bacterium]HRZ49661.1 glycosyltransferase family 2 protein [Bacteroidales bacterium]